MTRIRCDEIDGHPVHESIDMRDERMWRQLAAPAPEPWVEDAKWNAAAPLLHYRYEHIRAGESYPPMAFGGGAFPQSKHAWSEALDASAARMRHMRELLGLPPEIPPRQEAERINMIAGATSKAWGWLPLTVRSAAAEAADRIVAEWKAQAPR